MTPRVAPLVLALFGLLPMAASANPATASKAYDAGVQAYGRQELPAAAIHLKNALQADSKMLAAHLMLGKVLSA